MRHFNCLLTLVLLTGMVVESQTYAQWVVAHRGASHDAPENTLAAFQLAWKLGADGAEGDFHLTGDGEIVCHHDSTTDRTAGEKLTVAESTLTRLRQLDVGTWKSDEFSGETIATLSEVLQALPHGKKFFIEIKCGPEIVTELASTLSDAEANSDEVKIIAFDKDVISEVKRVLPDYEAYWLVAFDYHKESKLWVPPRDDVISTAKRLNADGVGMEANTKVLDSDFINACHAASLSTHVWTVNQPKAARYFAQLGVRSITTNRPDVVREAITGGSATSNDVSKPSDQ